MKIVILGLTITSSWGNGHATTFRALCRALHARGHRIDFIEKDVEWYRENRDLPQPPYCKVHLYADWELDGCSLAITQARDADVVVIGSYFPDAILATRELLERAKAPLAFYDIDTPITLAALRRDGRTHYLDTEMIPAYSAYMSFTGGPILREIENSFGSPFAVPLYCSVDPELYRRTESIQNFRADLSYLGTYAADRQPRLMSLLNETAKRLPEIQLLVAGSMYPAELPWSAQVRRLTHVAPAEHAAFYSSSKYTLNLTRQEMMAAGYSPSVRLFEASACGAAILSDPWPGLDSFLQPQEEVLVVEDSTDVVSILTQLSVEQRERIGRRASQRVLDQHTASHRAGEFEQIVTSMCSPSHKAVSPLSA